MSTSHHVPQQRFPDLMGPLFRYLRGSLLLYAMNLVSLSPLARFKQYATHHARYFSTAVVISGIIGAICLTIFSGTYYSKLLEKHNTDHFLIYFIVAVNIMVWFVVGFATWNTTSRRIRTELRWHIFMLARPHVVQSRVLRKEVVFDIEMDEMV